MERHFVEFAKKDGYNAYFQHHFASSRRSCISPHLKWEVSFSKLGDIGTLKGKVPMGVAAGMLRLLRYDSRAQGVAHRSFPMNMVGRGQGDEVKARFKIVQEGFVRVLGEDSAKVVTASSFVATQIPFDEEIAECRRLWEMAKDSLPDEAITYDVANNLGIRLGKQGKFEEAKVYKLAALKGH